MLSVQFGPGVSRALLTELEAPILIVCGRGAPARFPHLCEGRRCFSEVAPNPSLGLAERAASAARQAATVVGLGGGSALDVARYAARAHGRRTLVQVPTTAGSGSEMTPFASFWQDGRKSSFETPDSYADRAVIDPELTSRLSPELTLATGLDAAVHAVEALWGRHHSPESDAFAREALELSCAHLPECLEAPTPAHRAALMRAAMLAGMALSRTRSAAAHALSYPLTGHFGVPHGLAVGLFCRGLLPLMAGQPRAELWSPARQLFDRLPVDWRLRSYGVSPADFDRIVHDATASNRLANHPLELDLRALLEGML